MFFMWLTAISKMSAFSSLLAVIGFPDSVSKACSSFRYLLILSRLFLSTNGLFTCEIK